jgi:hypothetical protein
MNDALHVPADLYRGKSPRYPLDRRLGGPQSRYGRCGENKNLALAGNPTSAFQPIAVPSELSRLLIITIITTVIFCTQLLFKPPIYYERVIIVGVEISVGQFKTVFDK